MFETYEDFLLGVYCFFYFLVKFFQLNGGSKKKLAEGKFFFNVLPLANATKELCLSVHLFVCLSEASVVIGFILVS